MPTAASFASEALAPFAYLYSSRSARHSQSCLSGRGRVQQSDRFEGAQLNQQMSLPDGKCWSVKGRGT
jgi:hypothetical protein